MNEKHFSFAALKDVLLLWLPQAFSSLGSAMTSFALIVWSYQQEGSALTTALLSVCSYAPYVALSIFAGALSDRWNRKAALLLCDTFSALTTVAVLILLKTGQLRIGHLYLINALNGLMNTVQQPVADVVNTLLTPKAYYQRRSGGIFPDAGVDRYDHLCGVPSGSGAVEAGGRSVNRGGPERCFGPLCVPKFRLCHSSAC